MKNVVLLDVDVVVDSGGVDDIVVVLVDDFVVVDYDLSLWRSVGATGEETIDRKPIILLLSFFLVSRAQHSA
ncbi:hypothetical protein P8452_45167 [Trifolium repens]|nr:hypothetical protein P8452_45167 [Trifolium repens]